jgi:hypothetical protein
MIGCPTGSGVESPSSAGLANACGDSSAGPSVLRSRVVQAVTVAEVADELYALAPADFISARDERARQVRAAGQRDEAAAIKKLARPTASAWLVNQLARTAAEQMTRLYELGEELQEAQRALAGDRLRELSVQRRQVVTDLVAAASNLAGQTDQSASDAVLGEVRATLEAALADADARAAVRSGRLTKALAYAGLGEVDLTAAMAVPAQTRPVTGEPAAEPAPAPGRGKGRQPGDGGAARPGDTVAARGAAAEGRAAPRAGSAAERAADSLRSAQEAADIATTAFDEAERAVAAIDEQRQFLHRRISNLEQEIAEARTTHARLTREAKQAEGRQAVAARRLETANRHLDRARRAASGVD